MNYSEAEELAEPVERPAAAAAAVLLRAEREELAEGAREVLEELLLVLGVEDDVGACVEIGCRAPHSGVEFSRHPRDVVAVTASARWRGGSRDVVPV